MYLVRVRRSPTHSRICDSSDANNQRQTLIENKFYLWARVPHHLSIYYLYDIYPFSMLSN